MFIHSASFAPGIVELRSSSRIATRSACSTVPGRELPSIPKIPAMITSNVIACIRGASANGRPVGQRPISREAASAINCSYRTMASPWNGGSNSFRCRRCRGPLEVRTELGPSTGRSGDSAASVGTWSGGDVNSERM